MANDIKTIKEEVLEEFTDVYNTTPPLTSPYDYLRHWLSTKLDALLLSEDEVFNITKDTSVKQLCYEITNYTCEHITKAIIKNQRSKLITKG